MTNIGYSGLGMVFEAWLCATSVPKDVAWASRRDLLLCADTEEM